MTPSLNFLRIHQAAGKKVDLVAIFILDLKYGENEQARLQAVYDLGELKEKRAIPALKAAVQKESDDPVVAYSASKVLTDVFDHRISAVR